MLDSLSWPEHLRVRSIHKAICCWSRGREHITWAKTPFIYWRCRCEGRNKTTILVLWLTIGNLLLKRSLTLSEWGRLHRRKVGALICQSSHTHMHLGKCTSFLIIVHTMFAYRIFSRRSKIIVVIFLAFKSALEPLSKSTTTIVGEQSCRILLNELRLHLNF